MTPTILIRQGTLINEGIQSVKDLLLKNGRIEKIADHIHTGDLSIDHEIDATGKYILPGIIDDQVHFREPGLTHKATIGSEARAAVAGGVTSFMEMPNTNPTSTTQERLEEKYQIAARTALANYSFFMGATNDNLDEVLQTNSENICGVKVFMGSSTGNMLVDNRGTLEKLFANCPMLIATHCEDEATVRANTERYKAEYGDTATAALHPIIRNVEACYLSSSMAIELAKKHNTRLHILHISTAEELALFDPQTPLRNKRITAEACVHHLFFNANDYATLGNQIKCNPAIKGENHQKALFQGLLDNRLDIIATDHAPHTWDEKNQHFWAAPSGLPLVQHSLNVMLSFYHQGMISLERIVEKMCHAPAECFQMVERGYLREGYWADIAILDLSEKWKVQKENILYHCGWSPLEGREQHGKVTHTIVSGNLVYQNGELFEAIKGQRLQFEKK